MRQPVQVFGTLTAAVSETLRMVAHFKYHSACIKEVLVHIDVLVQNELADGEITGRGGGGTEHPKSQVYA